MLLDLFSALLSGYLILIGLWLIVLIIVLITLFNRKDIPLPVKLFWTIIIFIAPVIGLILYLILGVSNKKKLLPGEKRNDA